jgi:hypothetical protein
MSDWFADEIYEEQICSPHYEFVFLNNVENGEHKTFLRQHNDSVQINRWTSITTIFSEVAVIDRNAVHVAVFMKLLIGTALTQPTRK